MTTTKQVFLSYAPEDEPLRAKLEKHLSPLERSGKAMIWHAGKLLAGDVGRHAIEKQLRAADVILFLVTPDFLASDSLHDEQLQPALARSETEGVRVVPILAKPCAWRTSALAKLEPLPRNRTPITLWPHPDEGWVEVVDGLNEVLAQSTKQLRVSFSKESEPQNFRIQGFGPASFFRLHVMNRGEIAARGCVGQLLSVKALDSPHVDLLGKPMVLKWAHEVDFAPIAISPGESRLLDLFYILEGDTHLEFYIETPALPVGIRTKFPIRSYLVEVRLTAQDILPSTEVFRVESDGDWRNVQVRHWRPDATSNDDSKGREVPHSMTVHSRGAHESETNHRSQRANRMADVQMQSATPTNGPGFDDVTSSERSGVTLEQFVSGRLSSDIRLAFFLEQIGLVSERSDFRRAQFETYSDVWRSLQALRLVGDDLWSDASKTNLAAFASQLRKTTATVREGEIFFEEADRANLLQVLEEFSRYKFEKTKLVEFDRLSEYFIAKEGYSIAKIQEQIAKNRQHKLRYEAILENIRVTFKERLSSS